MPSVIYRCSKHLSRINNNYGTIFGLLLMLMMPAVIYAADSGEILWPEGCAQMPVTFQLPELETRQNLPLNIESIAGDLVKPISIFSGDVVITRGAQKLQTQLLRYNLDDKQLDIPGQLEYRDTGLYLQADSANFNLESESGQFQQVNYLLHSNNGKGRASSAIVTDGNQLQLNKVAYSTCQGETPAWQIRANKIDISAQTGRGTAKGATLQLKGVPVLYLPWLSFPIDDRRQTGFLYPTMGQSNDNGYDFSIPWYWNIAPNQDLTLTPRWITNRGFVLGSEYRFMTARTLNSVTTSYLPSDSQTNTNRYEYKIRHAGIINPQWRTSLLVHRVSDQQYFTDFGNSLVQSGRQFLRSEARISGRGEYWSLELIADDYQVLDEEVNLNRAPYSRVPRLTYRLDIPVKNSNFDFRLDSEIVSFNRDLGVTGARADLLPRLFWTLERAGGFIQPALGYRFTQYSLSNQTNLADSAPNRGTLIASLDAGLYFDRTMSNGGQQTLEPRMFYLYVPYKNQDNLPDFDTDEMTFGFGQLFHYNRFIGADRQGDANQLTLALTSRVFEPGFGLEKFNISIGQIFYFDDQRVSMGSQSLVQQAGSSDFIAELGWRPGQAWYTRAGVQWDWQDNEPELAYTGVEYQGPNHLRLGVEYRYRKDEVDQLDLRASVPINMNWKVVGRWNYDRNDTGTLEALAGFEYRSCCWAVRLMGRQYLRNRESEVRTGIYFEFELTGLGAIGREPYALFNDRKF